MSDLVEVQVIASGCSYFEKRPVLGPDGEQAELPTGAKHFVSVRKEARMGDVIQVGTYEASRLKEGGFVRDPSDKPILSGPQATLFTVPMQQAQQPDEPESANPRDRLTDEEIAELEAEEEARRSADEFDASEATDDELAEYLSDKNVKETLAVAKGPDGEYDPQVAARVLEAELERDKPRDGVVGPLEDVE